MSLGDLPYGVQRQVVVPAWPPQWMVTEAGAAAGVSMSHSTAATRPTITGGTTAMTVH